MMTLELNRLKPLKTPKQERPRQALRRPVTTQTDRQVPTANGTHMSYTKGKKALSSSSCFAGGDREEARFSRPVSRVNPWLALAFSIRRLGRRAAILASRFGDSALDRCVQCLSPSAAPPVAWWRRAPSNHSCHARRTNNPRGQHGRDTQEPGPFLDLVPLSASTNNNALPTSTLPFCTGA